MANQTYQACDLTRIQDATQISNTVTETIMVPDLPYAANYFTQGKTLRVTIAGVSSNVVTTPGTLTFRVRMGSAAGTSATISATSPAIALDPVARTSYPFRMEYTLVCRSAGTAGTILVMGAIGIANVATTVPSTYFLPASAPVTSAIDTTVANNLVNSAQFSVATNPTNLTVNQYIVESLN